MTQGILCFPSRLALRWSVFKLRTHFKFFPFYLKNMMMFWCHAKLTRTFNCVNLCVFMFTQVCFIPLCQIFMHMKPSFVSAGCVWISRGQNVSSLLSYRRAASKSVCVCVCVRSPWILPFELFTDMEQGWALQHAAGQQYGNWYHFFSLWLCFCQSSLIKCNFMKITPTHKRRYNGTYMQFVLG